MSYWDLPFQLGPGNEWPDCPCSEFRGSRDATLAVDRSRQVPVLLAQLQESRPPRLLVTSSPPHSLSNSRMAVKCGNQNATAAGCPQLHSRATLQVWAVMKRSCYIRAGECCRFCPSRDLGDRPLWRLVCWSPSRIRSFVAAADAPSFVLARLEPGLPPKHRDRDKSSEKERQLCLE